MPVGDGDAVGDQLPVDSAVAGSTAEPRSPDWGRGRPTYYQDRHVAEQYDRRYSTVAGRWKHRRKERLIGSWLRAAGTVLDVACGPGRFHSAQAGCERFAVDFSHEMLDVHRARHPRARVARCDAGQLPFADHSFDAVLCTRFLAHLRGEYRAGALAELARVSRGVVIIDARHRYNLRYVSRWVRRRLGLAKADKLRHTYRQLHEELSAAGLEIIDKRSMAWGFSARVLILAQKPA
ncbi:MAG: methyltransferase domain-containing protein [Planctomycetota bacterium]